LGVVKYNIDDNKSLVDIIIDQNGNGNNNQNENVKQNDKENVKKNNES
jgi:hypothetical protein